MQVVLIAGSLRKLYLLFQQTALITVYPIKLCLLQHLQKQALCIILFHHRLFNHQKKQFYNQFKLEIKPLRRYKKFQKAECGGDQQKFIKRMTSREVISRHVTPDIPVVRIQCHHCITAPALLNFDPCSTVL